MGNKNIQNIDKKIMLLSANWFKNYIPLVLPGTGGAAINSVQRSAMKTIKEVMGDESIYWNVSFSSERYERTKSVFIDNLDSERINKYEKELIIDFLDNDIDDDENEKMTLWLFWTITQTLIGKSTDFTGPPIDSMALSSLKKEAEKIESNNPWEDLEEIALSSDTVWDSYLRSLTPDLETYLSDFATEYFGNVNKFMLFWYSINSMFDITVMNKIYQWYIEKLSEFSDSDFKDYIPKWMAQSTKGRH